MRILNLIYLIVAELVKQLWLLPQTITGSFRQWRLQTAHNAREAERLDRIRHPSKYLGH
jgi:hypothetical protein